MLVIPAYRESSDFAKNLLAARYKNIERLLLVIVSNHPDHISDSERKLALSCHDSLVSALPEPSWQRENLSYHSAERADILLVDRTSLRAIKTKYGVGLARKIGADIALRLISASKIRIPWIFNTDSDARLSYEHFSVAESNLGSFVALVYPFKHKQNQHCDADLVGATELYEESLNHYRDGLSDARSPYAFHSVGSTIAVSPTAYAQSRGFPCRPAGEDFYLLNKVAKLGDIKSLTAPEVHLNIRHSDRVPFGTGPAVLRILEHSDFLDTKLFYHPNVFKSLGVFLDTMQSPKRMRLLEGFPEELTAATKHIKLDQFFLHASRQGFAEEQYLRQFHTWFDAFKTLKLVHFLRDNYWPNISSGELKDFNGSSEN